MATTTQPLLHGEASAPSSYGTSDHHHPHHHHHHHHDGHEGTANIPHDQPVPVVSRPQETVIGGRLRPPYHFLEWFTIGIIIWSLLGIIIWRWYPGFGAGRPHWGACPGNRRPGYSIPPGLHLTACEKPLRDSPGISQTTFEFAPSSDALLVSSAGSGIQGAIQVTTSANAESVKYYITLRTSVNHTADTIVCALKRRERELGVGILNPSWHEQDPVYYDVVVELPENYPVIKRFDTYVVNTSHNFGDLQGKVLFEELRLFGSNGGIKSESLFAQWVDIRTSNGPIEGYFNVSDYLTIVTSNSRIGVDIDFNQNQSRTPEVSLTTSNSPIKANLRLNDLRDDDFSKKSDLIFRVNTYTTDGRLDVTFQDAPVDSILIHRGATSYSPVEMSLHPTFEGHFALTTHSALFEPIVNEHSVQDPAGQGRERVVKYKSFGGALDGDVYWGNSSEKYGTIDVRTVNASATINL